MLTAGVQQSDSVKHAQSLNHVQLFAALSSVASRLLFPWNCPVKNTGVGCCFLLQRIFPTQGLNLCLLHLQADSLPLSHLEILLQLGICIYLTCLLRNLYAGQEATKPDMEQQTGSKLRKEYIKGCILSPCLCTYMQSIMRNARLDEVQTGIKIAVRNINNLRYADDTTLMAESKQELNSLLMRVKEKSENTGLKLNIQKLRSQHLVPSLHGK